MNTFEEAEYASPVGRFDADAIILEPKPDLSIQRLGPDFDAGNYARQDELGRVGQEIGDTLGQSRRVADNPRIWAAHLDIALRGLESRIKQDDLLQDISHIHRLQDKIGARHPAVGQK